jgi:hypothetical protein
MLLSFIYRVVVSLLKLLIGSGRPAQVKFIELIVLRIGRITRPSSHPYGVAEQHDRDLFSGARFSL